MIKSQLIAVNIRSFNPKAQISFTDQLLSNACLLVWHDFSYFQLYSWHSSNGNSDIFFSMKDHVLF